MVLTIYKLNASPPARAVLMTIEALKIPNVVYVDVDTTKGEHLTEEYLKLNPHHTVPMLKDDDFVVWDSHAICGYLVHTYGRDESLYPRDAKKKAVVDQRLHFDSGILFPVVKAAAVPLIYEGAETLSEDSVNKLHSAYELIDKLLTGKWLAGEELTLADICCVSTISSMNLLLPIEKDKYSNLWAWFQRCSQLPFYMAANEPGLQDLRELLKLE